MNALNGIYMPNQNFISAEAQSRFEQAKFQWAVVRTDSDPALARWCRDHGARVIMQLPDHFNRYPPQDPYRYAFDCLKALAPYEPFSQIACLDNEPNLGSSTGSWWFAGEFTRWIRGVHANFRWLDKKCYWELAFPAICHPWDYLGREFLSVGMENLRECEWVGVHVYWAGHDDYVADRAAITLQPYQELVPQAKLLVLEYGDGDPRTPDEREALDNQSFILHLPAQVHGACKFILAGTDEWGQFFLTDLQARLLGLV